jgi:transposase-like protein
MRGYVLRDPPDPGVAQERKVQWSPRRKAEVVEAVKSGKITIEETLRRHQLTEEEFRAWERVYDVHGLAGLRSTRVQQYRVQQYRAPRGPRSRDRRSEF